MSTDPTVGRAEATSHPLDPFSADEFRSTAALLARDHGVAEGWRFHSIELLEPSKQALADHATGGPRPPRKGIVTCSDLSLIHI